MAFTTARGAVENWRLGWPVMNGPQSPAAQETFAYLVAHSQPKDVVIFFKPRALCLMTGRLAVALSNPARLDMGDYLLTVAGADGQSQISAGAVAALQSQGKLKLIFEKQDFQLYTINHQDNW